MSLPREVAIVTGGSTGLGRAIAQALDDAEMIVIRAGLEPSSDALRRTVDVRDPQAVDDLIDDIVSQYGSLDVMINNAGFSAIADSSIALENAQWDAVVDTNLTGTWNGCRAAIRQMLDQATGGRIVNISSRLALSAGGPGRAAYAASKAAVSNLTRQLAVEYGRQGIRVNAVCPGYIPNTALLASNPERLKLAAEQTPSPRLGEPDDVAHAVAFLVSPAAGFINGHNLVVDGGASVRS